MCCENGLQCFVVVMVFVCIGGCLGTWLGCCSVIVC